MRCKAALCLLALLNLGFAQTPSASLQRLVEGNQRYTKDQLLHADHSPDRRDSLLNAQKPFAAILGCSDSRVIPEVIFDQGLGDLFVVRVAGNIVGPIGLDSIDYAVKILGASLIVVIGHESCGAVGAVMDGKTADIQAIAALIKPAIQGSKSLEEAVKDNVRQTVATLKKNPLFKRLLTDKKIDCVGAYYHLGTGNVEILK